MKSVLFRALPFLALLLHGCMSATLSNHDEIEMFPLRSATDPEGRQLKRCLRTAQHAQWEHQKKTGQFTRKISELNVDDSCQGLKVRQHGTPTGYEILAEIRRDETTVRWSVNEKGVMEEHLDDAPTGEIDSF